MNIRSWIGMSLLLQMIGVASLHAVIETRWIIVSVVLGIIGIILLMYRQGSNLYDPSIAPADDLYPGSDSDYAGSQAMDLLDQISNQD